LRCTQGQERGFSGGLQSSYSTSEMIRKFYPKWVKYSSEITLDTFDSPQGAKPMRVGKTKLLQSIG